MNSLLQRLATLHTDPGQLGPLATARRHAHYGDTILVRAMPEHPCPESALRVRHGEIVALDAWPTAPMCQPGDALVVSVAATPGARERFVGWLRGLTLPGGCSVAPCSSDDSGLHRLWCVGAARVALPAEVRVHARHDLLGIRLAQLALAMGADTLSGPITPERVLPLAGVPRPNESTRAGLEALVRNAGLTPQWAAGDDSALASSPSPTPRALV